MSGECFSSWRVSGCCAKCGEYTEALHWPARESGLLCAACCPVCSGAGDPRPAKRSFRDRRSRVSPLHCLASCNRLNLRGLRFVDSLPFRSQADDVPEQFHLSQALLDVWPKAELEDEALMEGRLCWKQPAAVGMKPVGLPLRNQRWNRLPINGAQPLKLFQALVHFGVSELRDCRFVHPVNVNRLTLEQEDLPKRREEGDDGLVGRESLSTRARGNRQSPSPIVRHEASFHYPRGSLVEKLQNLVWVFSLRLRHRFQLYPGAEVLCRN